MKLRDVLTLVLAGGVVIGLGGRDRSGFADLSNPLSYASSEVEAVADNLGAASAGRHLGFDTSKYPGDDAMKAWRDDGSYEWVGYYLPSAPCHRDASWAGKREQLSQMGWGLAGVYVGQ